MKIFNKVILTGLLGAGFCWLGWSSLRSANGKHLSLAITAYIILLSIVSFALFRLTRRKKSLALASSRDKGSPLQKVDDLCKVMFRTDLSGHFTSIGNDITSLTGYAPKELIHKNVSSLATPAFAKLVSDHFKRQHLTRRPESTIYFPILTRAGEQVWIEQLSLLTHAEGKLSGFECVIKNFGADKKDGDSLKPSPEIRRRYIAIPSSNPDQWSISKGSWRLPFSEQSLIRLLGLNPQ